MPSKGLMIAGGIGQGLKAGLDTFLKTRGLLNEEAAKRTAMEADAKKAALQRAAFILRAQKEGYAYDDASGALSETPEGKAIRDAELAERRAKADLMRERARRNRFDLNTRYGGGELEPAPEPTPAAKVAKPTLPAVGPMSPVRGPQSDDVDAVTQGLIDRAGYGAEMSKAIHGKDGSMSSLANSADERGLIKGVMSRYPRETGPVYDRKALLQYQKMYNSKVKSLEDIITNAKTIETFSHDAKTNPMKAAALPVMLARAVGEKGPLSNFDVQMWGGSKALVSRLHRAAQQMIDGTLPDEDLKFVMEVAQGLGQAAQERLAGAEEEVVGQFRSNYGGSPEWAYEKVTGRPKKKKEEKKTERKAMKGLKIGQEVDGFKYLGGDPNDQSSWSK